MKMRIAHQGYKYIGLSWGLAAIFALHPASRILSVLLLLLGAFVAFFFRDPERTPPDDPRLVVSPADGKIVHAGPQPGEPDRLLVSIFLSLFDVHVNRSPISARVERVTYTPGRFLPAYKREASTANEQNELELRDETWTVIVRQIAGVVARRILCFTKEGSRLERGQRLGLIQFGSRVDVLFPSEARLCVVLGEHVKGGESVIAERPP